VALKLLAPELARDERFRQRFLRESQLAGSLDHPHIVRTVASGDENGVLYLAMEYVEGADLRELLQREGRLDPERAIDLIGQVGGALDAAHAVGLVHRDVKPRNILVAEDASGEHAYLCDFGLARHVSSVSSLTGERGFVGTIDYVPPEQIEGGKDRRSRRRLLARLCSVRVLGGCAALRPGERALGRLRASERAAAASVRGSAGSARRVRRGLRDGAREIAERQVLHVRRAGTSRSRSTQGRTLTSAGSGGG
jgi:Serine/threonine protein kinase